MRDFCVIGLCGVVHCGEFIATSAPKTEGPLYGALQFLAAGEFELCSPQPFGFVPMSGMTTSSCDLCKVRE